MMKFKAQYQNHLESGILAQKADNASREVELYYLLNRGANKSKGREAIIQSPIKIKIKIWKH